MNSFDIALFGVEYLAVERRIGIVARRREQSNLIPAAGGKHSLSRVSQTCIVLSKGVDFLNVHLDCRDTDYFVVCLQSRSQESGLRGPVHEQVIDPVGPFLGQCR